MTNPLQPEVSFANALAKVANFIENNLYTETTRQSYQTHTKRFLSWLCEHRAEGHQPVGLPATSAEVAAFLDSIVASSADGARSAIAAAHRKLGLPDPTGHPLVAATVKRAHRERARSAASSSRPIVDLTLLSKLAAYSEPVVRPLVLRNRMALLLSAGTQHDPSDLSILHRENFRVDGKGLQVQLADRTWILPPGNDPLLCPVQTYQALEGVLPTDSLYPLRFLRASGSGRTAEVNWDSTRDLNVPYNGELLALSLRNCAGTALLPSFDFRTVRLADSTDRAHVRQLSAMLDRDRTTWLLDRASVLFIFFAGLTGGEGEGLLIGEHIPRGPHSAHISPRIPSARGTGRSGGLLRGLHCSCDKGLCPLAAVEQWLDWWQHDDGPVFPHPWDKRALARGQGMDSSAVSRSLRRLLIGCDMSSKGFSARSLTDGFVANLEAAGHDGMTIANARRLRRPVTPRSSQNDDQGLGL